MLGMLSSTMQILAPHRRDRLQKLMQTAGTFPLEFFCTKRALQGSRSEAHSKKIGLKTGKYRTHTKDWGIKNNWASGIFEICNFKFNTTVHTIAEWVHDKLYVALDPCSGCSPRGKPALLIKSPMPPQTLKLDILTSPPPSQIWAPGLYSKVHFACPWSHVMAWHWSLGLIWTCLLNVTIILQADCISHLLGRWTDTCNNRQLSEPSRNPAEPQFSSKGRIPPRSRTRAGNKFKSAFRLW